jgi:hypothetical protein
MDFTRRVFLGAAAAGAVVRGAEPARKARKDCFFGLHFDLHPNPGDPALGRDLTEEMVERFLERVKPDFVQYDSKGHVGYLGFPSKVGTSAPHIVKDSLAIWRKVTRRHGVALYIHFSGVWDNVATREHPDWAVVNAKGEKEPNATSLFGPYEEQLMIPELKEAAANYELDGAWIDGDCWATKLDYSEAAARAFRAATGIEKLPKAAGDAGWQEFVEFNREAFRRYVRKYVEALHAYRPGFQIASNWCYSTLVPEKPELPVDYISGDFGGNNAVAYARVEARLMSQQGMPWDLMGWGFYSSEQTGHVFKPSVQLEQEAAVVLAQGGAYQVYYNPTREGHLDDRLVDRMADLARFCRARQAVAHRSETIPEIGIVYSKHSLYRTSGRMFGGWGKHEDAARGMLSGLLECGWSVDVLPEWKVARVAQSYRLLVVPEWADLGVEMRDTLLGYVKKGGQLLVTGAENARLFEAALGVELAPAAREETTYLDSDDVPATVRGLWQAVKPVGAKEIGRRYPTTDRGRDGECAATLTGYGAGRIVCIYGPVGAWLWRTGSAAVREFLRGAVRQVFTPRVEHDGGPLVELVLRRKDGRDWVHLINAGRVAIGPGNGTIDAIPALGPIHLKAGAWRATVERLEIHTTVAIGG